MSAVSQQQQKQQKWTNSLFIPKIDFSITKNQLKEYMEKYVGKVSRIDFVSFNSDNGSGRRAFIHFTQWYNNDFAKTIRYYIEMDGFYDLLLGQLMDGAPATNNNNSKYIVRLLINKNPVPETEQTIQQVASNIDFMSEKIRIQEEEIQGLKQTCENLIFYTKQMHLRMNMLLSQQSQFPQPPPHYIVEDSNGEMDISELN